MPPAPPGHITVVGSANLDLVAAAPRIPAPGETVLGTSYHEFAGGKGLNQTIAAARQGAHVHMVGAVGTDPAGAMLIDTAATDGVDVTDIRRVDGVPTGRALISVDAHAENSILIVPGANAHVELVEGWDDRPTDLVLAQCEIDLEVVIAAIRRGRQRGAITVLNPSPATPLPDALLADVDVMIPNEHEVELIGGVDHLLAAGVGAVVVTRGASGIDIAVAATAQRTTQAAFPVDPIDTTGAGDACCGALVAALAAGRPLDVAVRRAAAAGALATTVAGAVPSLPTTAAVDALLAQHPNL